MADQPWRELTATDRPLRRARCDFIGSGDAREVHVWMLCNATLADLDEYQWPAPVYWRPAAPLPAGVHRYPHE